MISGDEGSSVSARSENDPSGRVETYGPIRFRRYVKDDGRALILYMDEGSAQDTPAQDIPAQDGPANE